MVYINETTFVMWDFPDIFEEMTGWFPVDEVIAPGSPRIESERLSYYLFLLRPSRLRLDTRV